MAKGRFRLSMQHYFRKEYEERGSEFGDLDEGRVAHVFKETGQKVTGTPWIVHEGGAYVLEQKVNAYVLSFSKSYSLEDQFRWFKRRGCYYDHCTVFDAKPLLIRLAHSIRTYYGAGEIYAGSAVYHSGVRDAAVYAMTPQCAYFSKRHTFEWENEYRLVFMPQQVRKDIHLSIVSLTSVGCIENLNSLYLNCRQYE